MKISIAGSVVSLLIAGVVALPMPPKHIDADVDPSPGKAPQTAANIEQHAAQYGTKTTTVGDLNTKEQADALREQAIGDQRIPGKVIDEYPPAAARTEGEPVSTAPTDPKEGLRKCISRNPVLIVFANPVFLWHSRPRRRLFFEHTESKGDG